MENSTNRDSAQGGSAEGVVRRGAENGGLCFGLILLRQKLMKPRMSSSCPRLSRHPCLSLLRLSRQGVDAGPVPAITASFQGASTCDTAGLIHLTHSTVISHRER